jgi:hypothetical protein
MIFDVIPAGAIDLAVPLKLAMAWGTSWAEAKEG